MITAPTAECGLSVATDFLARLKLDNESRYVPTLEKKKSNVAQFVQGLLNILTSEVCHGDIKPQNILYDEQRFDISDFGGSIIIKEVAKKMDRKFRFESEAEKNKMKNLVAAYLSPTTTEKRKETVCKTAAAHVETLVSGKLLKAGKKGALPTVRNEKKLLDLRQYMQTEFLPAKSDGYACEQYIQAMCDYFWRCDEKNFTKACQSFDIRAAGLTIYNIFTTERAPLGKDGTVEYYNKLESSLKALAISDRAVSIIRRMAEPMQVKPDYPNVDFDLPVSFDELKELKQIFLTE